MEAPHLRAAGSAAGVEDHVKVADPYSAEQKARLVRLFLSGEASLRKLSTTHEVPLETIQHWRNEALANLEATWSTEAPISRDGLSDLRQHAGWLAGGTVLAFTIAMVIQWWARHMDPTLVPAHLRIFDFITASAFTGVIAYALIGLVGPRSVHQSLEFGRAGLVMLVVPLGLTFSIVAISDDLVGATWRSIQLVGPVGTLVLAAILAPTVWSYASAFWKWFKLGDPTYPVLWTLFLGMWSSAALAGTVGGVSKEIESNRPLTLPFIAFLVAFNGLVLSTLLLASVDRVRKPLSRKLVQPLTRRLALHVPRRADAPRR